MAAQTDHGNSLDGSTAVWKSVDLWAGVAVVSGAVFYRPLTFWASNAWDLAAPQTILMTGLVELIVGIALLLILRSTLQVRLLLAALQIGAVLFVIFNWAELPLMPPALWLVVLGVAVFLLASHASEKLHHHVALVITALLLVAPAIHLVFAHLDQRMGYPVHRSEVRGRGQPTGNVEDVLVLIIDSYPMTRVADTWFGHETATLTVELGALGFATPPISWSHNTFTGLALPSILELSQVIEPSSEVVWGNRKDRYDITRGNSYVATSLRDAGFAYTHIESGLNGGVCGDVDSCLQAPWLDEANGHLLAHSLFGPAITNWFGPMSVRSTLRSAEHLQQLSVFDNGEHDYVFAHFILPHPPYIVDDDCMVIDGQSGETAARIRQQLECVDSLLLSVLSGMPEDTATLVAGDHGTSTNGQIGKPEAEWSDSDIAERLGALLAYRLPAECSPPDLQTNVAALRAIVDCALIDSLPEFDHDLILGERSPQMVPSSRLTEIEEQLRTGSLLPG